MESKKSLFQETNPILNIWKQQKWLSYDEIEPNGKEKAHGIFKIIQYKMPKKFNYVFQLTQEQYKFWRTIKPSFILGK